MSPSTNPARATVTRPEPGQKRGQVWGKGVGWESVLRLPLGPCIHPGVEATLAPKESYPKVPTIPELGMTADFGQVTFPLGASLSFIFSTQGVWTRRSLGSIIHHNREQDGGWGFRVHRFSEGGGGRS